MRANKTEAEPSQKLTGHGTEQPGQGDHALCKGAGFRCVEPSLPNSAVL